jgi:hypothetical protein
MHLNKGRIWLGGLAGGVVWTAWSFIVGFLIVGMHRYQAAQDAGLFMKTPRYPAFQLQWIVIEFILAIIVAHLYVWSRATLGPGPGSALKIGFLAGFAIGFPSNFAQAAWSPIDRMMPLGWLLEFWVGAILATLVAGWLYKE